MTAAMRFFLLAAGALVVAAATAARAEPDPAFGEWLNEDGDGRVAIAPCPGAPSLACGAVTWVKDPNDPRARDRKNPDRALRGRPLVGVVVIRDMKNEGPGRWSGGKIYEPDSGRTYDGKMKAISRNRLEVSGCFLMICKGQTWTRPR